MEKVIEVLTIMATAAALGVAFALLAVSYGGTPLVCIAVTVMWVITMAVILSFMFYDGIDDNDWFADWDDYDY